MKIGIIEYQYYSKESNGLFKAFDLKDDITYKRVLITNHIQNRKDDKTFVLNHTNQGKDIGAKLIGIDWLLTSKEDFDIIFFVHDKKSPHSPLGAMWYDELTKIFKDPFITLLQKKMNNREVGACCSEKYIKTEIGNKNNRFNSSNDLLIKELLSKYELKPPKPFYFVAGTIFCCRWEPIKDFFGKNNPLGIRATLETGNVQDVEQGSYTHAWERLFSWIITSAGYKIEGL